MGSIDRNGLCTPDLHPLNVSHGAVRLAVVLTHPIQYYSPWFRYMASRPELDLTVLYAAVPTPRQQGVGFDRDFTWDSSLRDGYRSLVLRSAGDIASVGSDRFWGAWAPEVAEALRTLSPDAALIPGWHSATYVYALWACRHAGIPTLFRGDTNLLTEPGGLVGRFWRAKTQTALSCFDAFLAPGIRTREFLRRFVPEAHTYDSPHAVDNAFFGQGDAQSAADLRSRARAAWSIEPGSFVALFAGKLQPKKRPLDLIRAVAGLHGARLLVAGSGELEPACRAEAERLSVPVTWAGFLNQSEMPRVFAAADVLVLPSDSSETWGLVVNEAMASGIPCVVSDQVGCAPDLIAPGVTGETFPVGDVRALSAALERVRRRRSEHDFASACRDRVAAHSFEAATNGLLAATTTVRRRPRVARTSRVPRVLACCGSMFLVSGLERMTFEVLRTVVERGGAVHCILNSWEWHRLAAFAEEAGASWTKGRYFRKLSRHARNPLTWFLYAADVLRTSAGLLRDAARFRATHILLPDFTVALRNAPALLLFRALRVPVVLRLGNAPDESPFYRRLFRTFVSPLVDVFVCNSGFTQGALLKAGIPKEKTAVVYNAVPTRSSASAPPKGAPRNPARIVYVGQLIPGKGVDRLLEAVALLLRRGVDVSLDVAGKIDGWVAPEYAGHRERLLARSLEADLAGHVRFLGYREDVPALLSAAAVHVFPSLPEMREGFGVVTLEAKAAGIPSVVTPSGALPEVVRHLVDGWVCKDASPEAIAEGLAYFIGSPDRAAAAGQAARESLETFSRERLSAAWGSVFTTRRA